MKIASYVLVLLIPVLVLCSCDGSTTTEPEPVSGYMLNKYHLQTELPCNVNIMFQVTNMDSVGIDNIADSDFRVYENDDPISPTESVMRINQREGVPYSLKTVIMLDNSASIESQLTNIQDAAKTLVRNITDQQAIAIYQFSETAELIQDFTSDTTSLITAVESIEPGYYTTDLYGSIIEGLSRWNDYYELNSIQQGFLIALTDGDDTQNNYTLAEVIEAQGDKRVFTIGLGPEIDPDILEQLGNAGSFILPDSGEIITEFTAIQNEIINHANSFYWLDYTSPARGENDQILRLEIANNENQDESGYIQDVFESEDFYSVYDGLYINVTDSSVYGIDTLIIAQEAISVLRATSYMGANTPSYTWTSLDPTVVTIIPNASTDRTAFITAIGQADSTAIIVIEDTANNYTADLTVIINSQRVWISEDFESSTLPDGWVCDDGHADWICTNNFPFYGDYCVSSGSIDAYQTSTAEKIFEVPSDTTVTISFARRVSSQNPYDRMFFLVDDISQDSWYGDKGWEIVEYSLSTDSEGVVDSLSLMWVYERYRFSDDQSAHGMIDLLQISW